MMKKLLKFVPLILLLSLSLGIPAQAQTISDTCIVAVEDNNPSTGPALSDIFSTSSIVFPPPNGNPFQAAVSAASDGDVIKIAGTCEVGATFNPGSLISTTKSLTFRGGYNLTDAQNNPTAAATWNNSDPDANETILDASGLARILFVTGSVTVRVENLTLRDGLVETGETGVQLNGGAINVANGTLFVERVNFINNGTPATEGGRGGAIYTENGSVTVEDSTFDTNAADNGGGAIFALNDGANITVERSTFNLNTTGGTGASAIQLNASGNLTVINSTFNLNAGNGAAIVVPGDSTAPGTTADIQFSTFADNVNGSGAEAIDIGATDAATLTFSNNVLADNGADICAIDGTNVPTPTIAGNFQAVADTDCGGTVDANTLTLLGLLQDNGGPTDTRELQTGHPAIDSAAGTTAVDQRGFGRDTNPDSGAFEADGVNVCGASVFPLEIFEGETFDVTVDCSGISESVLGVEFDSTLSATGTANVTTTAPAFTPGQFENTATNPTLPSENEITGSGAAGQYSLSRTTTDTASGSFTIAEVTYDTALGQSADESADFALPTFKLSDELGTPITFSLTSPATVSILDLHSVDFTFESDGTVDALIDASADLTDDFVPPVNAMFMSVAPITAGNPTAVVDFDDTFKGDNLTVTLNVTSHLTCIFTDVIVDGENPLEPAAMGPFLLRAGNTDNTGGSQDIIDSADSAAVTGAFGGPGGTPADVNGDNVVNVLDLVHVGRNFGFDASSATGDPAYCD